MFEHKENFAWLILLLPLFAAGAITIFARDNKRLSAQLSVGAVLASFLVTVIMFGFLRAGGGDPLPTPKISWLYIDRTAVGELWFEIALKLDRLSLMMALIVTGVGGLIHIYSSQYMRGDRAYYRYFACLSLFTFSMLGIVLADNLVMMFIFWELVGVSSYLLIGFWYEKETAADAAKKAFLTNRLGDFGFLLGILMVWAICGSLDITWLSDPAHRTALTGCAMTTAGLLLFCGAVGKSAQFPLHVWLPDAMEGPTPVSALIHAATMVAAGVYMLCRVFFIFDATALQVIAWTGGITALMAAVIAVQQNDIKRILAYSTLSQLGYMVMAVGLGGPTPAMFHLTTHAFFKALLFLGAGSVILALHHEQDIWKMGALKKKMPVTYWTFMAGTLALCGVIPLSGFYSKDSILAQALESHSYGLFVLGVVVAGLTTFYMFRLALVVFYGEAKSHAVDHAHESPGLMAWPLRILAVFSVIGAFIGIEQLFDAQFEPDKAGHAVNFGDQLLAPFNESPLAAIFGLFAVVVGFSLALALYRGRTSDPLPEKLGFLSKLMRNRFYFDEIYEKLLIPCTQGLASLIANAVDQWVIHSAVRFTHGTTELAGRVLRLMQTGSLQHYAFVLVLGVALVLWFVLGR